MGGYVYRLFLEDGSDVGTFTTAAWDWKPGDEFWDGDHRLWRVLDVAPVDGNIYRGLFMVEPADRQAQRTSELADG